MAVQDYATLAQTLYVTYFGRPGDYFGMQSFQKQLNDMKAPTDLATLSALTQADKAGTTALSKLVNSFSASKEATDLYGTDTSPLGVSKFVEAIYLNVLGRAPDTKGWAFWTEAITSGALPRATAAAAIADGALNNATPQGLLDAKIVANKIAVAADFTNSLVTVAQINGYAGNDAAATARGMLTNVKADTVVTDFHATVVATVDAVVASLIPSTIFNLTTGVDAFVGGAGGDVFNATVTSTSAVLGGLDSIDGGAGVDTLNIADTATPASGAGSDFVLPAGFTIKNIEKFNLTTNGAIGNATAFDLTGMSGLTSATLIAGGAGTNGGSNVKAAGTTDVNLTVGGANTATISGGHAVTVHAVTGNVGVSGSALTSVTVKGGAVATIDNISAGGTSAAGTTLTSVTLDGAAIGATTAVKGAALTNVTLNNIATAGIVTVTNGTASHTQNVAVDGTGYSAAGAAVVVEVVDAKATTLAVTATHSNTLKATGVLATKVTVAGTGDVALDLAGSTALTSVDASANSGGVALTGVAASAVSIKGGSGADTITTTQIDKVTFDMGAGKDIVTVATAIAAGSSINLNSGDDFLLFKAGGSVAQSTATATTVIDGGDGFDTVSANLINAGNAAQFKNFEALNLDSTTGLDVALLTGNSISGLVMSTASTSATYQNVTQAMGLTVNYVGDNSGVTNTLKMTGVSGAADAYSISFNAVDSATPGAANVKAGTIVAAGIENFSIVSGGTKAWNSITLGADTSAEKVTITGAAKLNLAFSGAFGDATDHNGVSLIDGSAATGALNINTANVVAAASGLTVNGGSAADTITLAGAATVNAGAGDDTIISAAAGGTFTGGAGNDTFDTTAAVAGVGAAPVIATITDAAAGDVIKFLAGGTTGTVTFTSAKIDVSTATALFGGTVNALDLAAKVDGTVNNQIEWFQYNGNTYIVDHVAAGAAFGTGDQIVKIVGLVDLSHATFADGGATGLLTLV